MFEGETLKLFSRLPTGVALLVQESPKGRCPSSQLSHLNLEKDEWQKGIVLGGLFSQCIQNTLRMYYLQEQGAGRDPLFYTLYTTLLWSFFSKTAGPLADIKMLLNCAQLANKRRTTTS